MIREVRAAGGAVRSGDMGERVFAAFGGSVENGVWFRYNSAKLRVADMLEEVIHWNQIQSGLISRGYSATALELLAKRAILSRYGQSLGNPLKFELLDDISRLKAGTYLEMP